MTRDDEVLPVVRVVAAIIVVVLLLAVVILYFMPGETERFWAWTIAPEMTPLLMGAGYASGAYFFTRVLLTRSWRTVSLGFLPITAFTSMLLIATLLHWENFNHSHVAFFAWTFLYAVTPFLVPTLWFFNSRRDPGVEAGENLIPAPARGVLSLTGIGILAVSAVSFVTPSTLESDWPWQLSDLTSRVVAAYVGLTGGSLLLVGLDSRWRASKVILESLVIGTTLLIVAIIRAWSGLDPSEAVRWSYLASMIVFGVLLVTFYLYMEHASRSSPAVTPG
jgi:hypothetical protein